jgi:fluoride exporter
MREAAVVGVVGLGGAAGAAARYGLGLAWPEAGLTFPWTTFAINVVGSLAIGVLLAALERRATPHPAIRPLLGTGFLGGFTTLSAYADQTRILLSAGRWVVAAAYVAATLIGAVAAVWLGTAVGRAMRPRP